MSELLVLLACYQHTGCTETSNQYYIQHPQFVQIMQTEEAKLTAVLGQTVTQYWAPALWAISGQESTVRLTSKFSLTASSTKQTLNFKKDF